MGKPADRWIPKRLGPRHVRAAHLLASGVPRWKVAALVGIVGTTLSHWSRNDAFTRLVADHQERLMERAERELVARLVGSGCPNCGASVAGAVRSAIE